jgi:hypothetical protein
MNVLTIRDYEDIPSGTVLQDATTAAIYGKLFWVGTRASSQGTCVVEIPIECCVTAEPEKWREYFK